jgi:hypothetical protein
MTEVWTRRFSDLATDDIVHAQNAKALHKSWGHDNMSKQEREKQKKEAKEKSTLGKKKRQ